MERVLAAAAGFFVGGFLGWFMGVAWYELVEVPKAASMSPMTADAYLCSACGAPAFLAILGAILGAVVGARKSRTGVPGESQDQPQ